VGAAERGRSGGLSGGLGRGPPVPARHPGRSRARESLKKKALPFRAAAAKPWARRLAGLIWMASNQFSISESLVVSAYAILRASLLTARSLFCRPEVPGGESQRLTEVAEGHELRESQVRC
jgi:hypothetical protein